jgi:hypothetical protein
MGVNYVIIAAALGLQSWKNLWGVCEWMENDVEDLLEEYRA